MIGTSEYLAPERISLICQTYGVLQCPWVLALSKESDEPWNNLLVIQTSCPWRQNIICGTTATTSTAGDDLGIIAPAIYVRWHGARGLSIQYSHGNGTL